MTHVFRQSSPAIWRFVTLCSVAWVLAGPAGIVQRALGDDWPQWLGPQRDSRWRESGVIERFPDTGPTVRWRTPVKGGYSGPAVADGRVFVMDYETSGDKTPDPNARNQLVGQERVLCLDRDTGQTLWEHRYPCNYEISFPAGPRATPTVDGDRVYTLGAEGDLHCLETQTGHLVWAKNFSADFGGKTPLWGFCGHPLVVQDTLYVIPGGPDQLVVALDKRTGETRWHSQDAKEPGYSAPTLIEAGGHPQLLVWHATALISVNPDNGALYWSEGLEPDYGMAIITPRLSQDLLFVGGIGAKSMMIQLSATAPTAKVLWYGDQQLGLDPIHSTPIVENGILYGVNREGRLTAMQMDNGRVLWSNFDLMPEHRRAHSGTVFMVKNGDHFYLMTDSGQLVIAQLTPASYQELSRAQILAPTGQGMGRSVVWSHPAFANRCVFARNDQEIVCVSLAAADAR